MLNQKKVEIFLAKFHKSLAKQFLEVAVICYKPNVFVLLRERGYVTLRVVALFFLFRGVLISAMDKIDDKQSVLLK